MIFLLSLESLSDDQITYHSHSKYAVSVKSSEKLPHAYFEDYERSLCRQILLIFSLNSPCMYLLFQLFNVLKRAVFPQFHRPKNTNKEMANRLREKLKAKLQKKKKFPDRSKIKPY